MANTKQALKMIRKIKTRTARNRAWKNKVKTAIKSLDKIISQEKPEADKVVESLRLVQKNTDKAVKTGAINKSKANRIKSRISKRIKKNNIS
ncbi:30S ribosomal protein S20 [candidate division WWE3 bacterium CG_4_9_14_3_um_filter_34_6]|uniref:Small ribosomal subunit protein bS20 n=1 Tax=candidate division WWE3 bacterium CG_4_9_14_3_um_filter_34_6 TaxID=1975079 RepID=A0A2M7X2U4_UNCKA|nr:MAG: 30S ribosomal protein S20 [candidate division WWE3 bacterium CG_4_9_14_3_um_filter_34_6]